MTVSRPFLGEAGGFLVLSALLLLPGVLLGPYQDAGIFATIGEQLTRGALPYRDAWDHKPPGTYLVAAVAALLPGPTWPAFWAIAVAWLAATGMVLRRGVGLPLAAIAVVSMGLYPAAVGGGETEAFAALPAAFAFLGAWRSRWLLAGVAAGVALTFSVQSAPLLAALLVFAGTRPRPIALGALGIGLVGAVVVGGLAVAGILPEAFDAVVVYNRLYLESDRSGDLPVVFHLAVVLLPLGVALPFIAPRRLDRADAAAIAWLVVSALFLATQGRLIAHYVIPLAIPLAILARGPWAKRPAIAAVALATLAMVAVSVVVAVRDVPLHRGRIAGEIGAWVLAHTDPGETVLVWGVDAGVYVVAERAPAGRYPYALPLVTHGYATPTMIRTWVAELDGAPPRLIVDSEAVSSYWPDDADFLRPPAPGAAGGRDLDLLDPLRDWARPRYVLVEEIEGRKIYRRIDR